MGAVGGHQGVFAQIAHGGRGSHPDTTGPRPVGPPRSSAFQ
ncbi:hypothetical protein [Streptomyces sp. ADI98-10]|nr:hypothetical protein [Streptomyces sp. ADI98-10]RPK94516.1 hypothetical protein EES46_01000 [Streptomyces sp. ADI98-10]